MKRAALATSAVGAVLLAATTCGCSAGSHSAPTVKESPSASASAPAGASASASAAAEAAPVVTVTTRKAGGLGTVLVDQNGRTLYLFEADKTTRSTCYGSCAAAWPPLITSGTPKSGGAAKPDLLKTSRRSGGATQVLYDGHPLYRYVGDTHTGDTHGQGLDQFGARWFVLAPDGAKVDKS